MIKITKPGVSQDMPGFVLHYHIQFKTNSFGSVLTGRFNDKSDVDLIVDFDKQAVQDHFIHYFDFKYSLEDVLGREVDLLEEQPIRNSFLRKNIEQTKVLIYG